MISLHDLHRFNQFYNCRFEVDHDVAGVVLPSNQLFAAGLLNFMNVPDNGSGLYYMKPVSDYLIRSFIEEVGVELSAAFYVLYNKFWAAVLTLNSEDLRIKSESTRGFRLSNPSYAFLFISSAHGGASCLVNNSMINSFVAFSPFFFKKINLYRKLGYSDGFIERLCLVARKLVVASKYVTVKNKFKPTRYEKEQISRVALSVGNSLQGSIFEISNKTYVLDLLFRAGRSERDKVQHERRVGDVIGRWSDYENGLRLKTPISLPEDLILDKYFRVTDKKKVWTHPETVNLEKFGVSRFEIEEAGEDILDYIDCDGIELPAEFFSDPWRSQRNENQKMEALVFSNQVLPWDKDVVAKGVLKRIFQMIHTLEKEVASIICLSLFLGMKENQIKCIHCNSLPEHRCDEDDIGKVESSFKGFNLDMKENVFWDYSNGISRDDINYLKIDPTSKIRLPIKLIDYLPSVDEGYPLFSSDNLMKAKRFLKTLGQDGIRNVTLGRLVKTFEAFFIHSFGLPILYADILSGTKRHYLKSQHFYVTQNQGHLNNQWLGFVQDFLDEYDKPLLIGLRNPPPTSFCVAKYKLGESIIHIGATNTPSRAKLKKHFALLYSRFPHTRDELLKANEYQWNAYIAYLFGIFSVCTGQRPLRDPMPDIRELSFGQKIIHVTDKNSHSHREERCVPLVELLEKSLLAHQSIISEWRLRIIIGNQYMLPSKPPFLPMLTKDGKVVSASSKVIDMMLAGKIGKNYIFEIKNGYRHFLLTTLFQSGVNQADIDWISGHRSKNMEPESIYSPISWNLKAKSIKGVINDDIVNALNLEVPFV